MRLGADVIVFTQNQNNWYLSFAFILGTFLFLTSNYKQAFCDGTFIFSNIGALIFILFQEYILKF